MINEKHFWFLFFIIVYVLLLLYIYICYSNFVVQYKVYLIHIRKKNLKYLYFKKAGLGTQVQYLINCPRNHVITIIILLLNLFCVKKITYLCAMCYLIVMIFFCCCEKNPAIIICSLLYLLSLYN